MLESTLIQVSATDQRGLVAWYSLVNKSACEIFNYVSPTLRVFRLLEGSAYWRIADSLVLFQQGDIVVTNNICKRNIHQVITHHILVEVFDFYPSRLANERLWTVFYLKDYQLIHLDDSHHTPISRLLDSLKDEILNKQDDMRILSICRILDLLAIQLRRMLPTDVDSKLDSALFSIANSLQYIAEHYCEPISVAALAESCNYSPEHYSRMFHKYIGISPMKYITNIRLEQVVHLINTKDISIMDAALQCGFRTSAAFYKAFRANYHAAPREYIRSDGQNTPSLPSLSN